MIIRRLFKALGIVLGTAFLLICLLNVFFYRISITAGPFDARWDGLIWNPPKCEVDGSTLNVVFPPTEEFWNRGIALGTVIIHPKTKELLLAFDKTHFRNMPPEIQRFTVYHECAHAKLGHLKILTHDDPNSLEREADCYAMEAILRENWKPERMDKLYASMLDGEIMGPALRGVKYNEFAAKAHAWTPQERVDHLKSCITP